MKKINIKMRIILAVIISFTTLSPLFSQQESTLFKAMRDEMNRSMKELKLPNSPAPWFISYITGETSYISVIASKGVLLNSKVSPKERVHSVNLLVGNSEFSSDYSYTGNGIISATLAPSEDNYDQLRRGLWQTTDNAYKFAVEVYKSKQNNIKNANLTDEEKTLHDMIPLSGREKNSYIPGSVNMNRKSYEELSKKLSAEFSKYPYLSDSRVSIDIILANYYYVSTEGREFTEAVSFVILSVNGKVRNKKGQVIRDNKVILSSEFEKLPSEQELIKVVNEFAVNMGSLQNASEMDEYYFGPVLFESEATAAIFASNLVSPSGIFSFRKPIQVMASVARVENISSRRDIKPLEERVGKKVIDSRITVVNKTDLKTFGTTPLIGSYSTDAQGVVPVKEITLIENGILKNLLSTRVPTRKSKSSTGSLRFGARPRSVSQEVSPGVLEINAPSGSTLSQLKDDLIKAAKEEGLEYAYIVRKITGESDQYIYRVSVKDGSETLVIGAEISSVPLNKLKRVLGVTSNQKVFNYLYQGTVPVSLIYPEALLIEDIEINKKPLNIVKDSPLISK
ncbi:MAG: metallopeptidase TldD-related protein [Bacteroidales bacterium]